MLHLLFALDKVLDERVVPSCDLLIFSTGENLRSAQKLACQLRKQGYSVARDILDRTQEEALDYARQMNYRFMAVVAGEDREVEIISLLNGEKKQISWQQLNQSNFELQ